MKITIVTPSFYPAVVYGGPIFSTFNACNHLVKKKVKVSVCTTNANGLERLEIEPNVYLYDFGYPVKYYNDTFLNKLSLPLFFSLWKDILSCDSVHAQYIFSTSTPIALLYARVLKKKIVLSPRGALGEWCLSQGSKFKKTWINLFIRPFTKHIVWHATSTQEENEIKKMFGEQRINVIPNGIDLEKFFNHNFNDKYFVDKFHLDSGDKVIVSLGRIQEKKGFDILIKAFSKVISDGIKAKLFIAGPDYGNEDELIGLCSELQLTDSVKFIGPIDGGEKLDFLGAADVFVLPSHNENFGNVYAESLACGTPIIASKNTPWRDVSDFDCGLWVDNTAEENYKAIKEILSKDLTLLNKNSLNYVKRYSWEVIADKFKKMYEGV